MRAPPTRVHHGSPPASQQAGLLLAGRGPAPSWRRRACGVVSGKRTDPMSGVKRSAALRAREGGSGNYWFVTLFAPAYWQRWHSMRSATPRPPPSVSVLTPLRELRGELSPERLGAIQPLFDAVQCLIGVHCTAPKRQRLRWPRWVANSPRNFNSRVSTSEHFVYNLTELGVQQAAYRRG